MSSIHCPCNGPDGCANCQAPIDKHWYIGVFGPSGAGKTTLMRKLYDGCGIGYRTPPQRQRHASYIWNLIFENYEHIIERWKPNDLAEYQRWMNEKPSDNMVARTDIFVIIRRTYPEVSIIANFQALVHQMDQIDARVRPMFANWVDIRSMINHNYTPTMTELASYVFVDPNEQNVDEFHVEQTFNVSNFFGLYKKKKKVDFVFIDKQGATDFNDLKTNKKKGKSILVVLAVNEQKDPFSESLNHMQSIIANSQKLRIDVFANKCGYPSDKDHSEQFNENVAAIKEQLQSRKHHSVTETDLQHPVTPLDSDDLRALFTEFLKKITTDPNFEKFLNA